MPRTLETAALAEGRIARTADGRRLVELPKTALNEIMRERNRYLLSHPRRSARAATTTTVPTPAGIRQQGPWAIAYSVTPERRAELKRRGLWADFVARNPWAAAYS